MFWARAKKLLGMNARNLLFIRPNNSRSTIRLADDKLATKRLLRRNKIPVGKVMASFDVFSDVEEFDWTSLPSNFVIKPNRGFGGEGIWVIKGMTRNGWKRSDGMEVDIEAIKNHIYNIFDGNYSLGNVFDTAYIEEKISLHSRFKKLTYGGGIPDVRVIVYNMIPVMAMLRLPTEMSRGKANLHQGGIGVGVEIASGITTKAFVKLWDQMITRYPGTEKKLHGIKIPFWKEVLEMSVKCQQISGLGYLGVDIVLDEKKGPMVLEINARPGLDIQNANFLPLRSRLLRVEDLHVNSVEKGVRIAQELFGGEVNIGAKKDYGKSVLDWVQPVEFIGLDKKKLPVMAKIDTGAWRTAICRTLADRLKLKKPIQKKLVKSALGREEREIYEVKMVLGKKKITTQVFVADRRNLKYDVIIGRRDLQNFLINPKEK
ncbi:MAG: sugar-transfer associated ATP-grasp domain-containing protein [Patescibacteria group bacterium]